MNRAEKTTLLLQYLNELNGIALRGKETHDKVGESILSVCAEIESHLLPNEHSDIPINLSTPLNIQQRIMAAIADAEEHHTIYYHRREGASHSVRGIADGNRQITVISGSVVKKFYTENHDVHFKTWDELMKYDGIVISPIVIADAVPDKVIGEFKACYSAQYTKLIVLKGITTNGQTS